MIESFKKEEIKGRIDKYINGKLSEDEIDELWAELIQDGYHLDYLKSAANLREVLLEERERGQNVKTRQFWSYAAAAVLALTIGVLSVFYIPQFNSGHTVQPIENIELDYYRSAEGVTGNIDDHRVIREAITLANRGKFEQAITLLREELDKAENPKWASELNINLGSLFYNEGLFNKSVVHFKRVLDRKKQLDMLTVEKAYWYLGNAYFQLDQMEMAEANIKKAYELNGAYRRVAESYLNALASR